MLQVRRVRKQFGGLRALADVDLDVPIDRIVAVIGPNGAGKTTLFNVMSGFYRPDDGDVLLDDESLVGLKPHEVSRRGIARTFQICKPFPDLSVLDNVVAGAFTRVRSLGEATEIARTVLQDVGLHGKRAFLARYLTLPELKRLEVARALAVGPKYLLLDEVMAGLNLKEQHDVADEIERIHARGIGIVLVEHSHKPDRVFNRPVPLGDIFVIRPEGLEGPFLESRPDPAFPLLPLCQQVGIPRKPLAEDRRARGHRIVNHDPGLVRLGLQFQPDPNDISPAPSVLLLLLDGEDGLCDLVSA